MEFDGKCKYDERITSVHTDDVRMGALEDDRVCYSIGMIQCQFASKNNCDECSILLDNGKKPGDIVYY